MPITLGSNISSLRGQRQLLRSSQELETVFERLSSGQRINRASDDAAGLAIADSLNANARVFTQGVRNLNDGISVVNIADGALQELTNITFRLTELAEQAANGTFGVAQRASLDEEAQALKDEYFRIAKTTEFNGRNLFEGDYGVLSLQVGYGSDALLSDGLGGAIGTGEFSDFGAFGVGSNPSSINAGDFNGDGNVDILVANQADDTLTLRLGIGNGSFHEGTIISTGDNPTSVKSSDFNNDGILDIATLNTFDNEVNIYFGHGDGTFTSASTLISDPNSTTLLAEDLNNDGYADIIMGGYNDTLELFINNRNGTFAESTLTAPLPLGEATFISVADFNGDGNVDIATGGDFDLSIAVISGNGDGTFNTAASYSTNGVIVNLEAADLNNDGHIDLISDRDILLNDGEGNFGTAQSYASGTHVDIVVGDFNGDGMKDIGAANFGNSFNTYIGNGDGSFDLLEVYTTGANSQRIITSDLNNDGVLDLGLVNNVDNNFDIFLAHTNDGVAPLLEFSLTTIADAKQALSQFTQKLDQLSKQRGELGAFQSRIEVAGRVLQVSAENFKAAESRIRDADIAQESANLNRLQILQQAASAVLSQANLQPQLVLQLLGN